jgi:hypothetical protein
MLSTRWWAPAVAEFDPVALLRVLLKHRVDFVVVGGVAARLRGAPLITQDVDITPSAQPDNLDRLTAALEDLEARLRTSAEPDGVAMPFDPALIRAGEVWTLVTKHGDLDLVMEPAGTDGYRDLVRDSGPLTVSRRPDVVVEVASLADVIRSKEATGREKDRAALPLLRRTLEEAG